MTEKLKIITLQERIINVSGEDIGGGKNRAV